LCFATVFINNCDGDIIDKSTRESAVIDILNEIMKSKIYIIMFFSLSIFLSCSRQEDKDKYQIISLVYEKVMKSEDMPSPLPPLPSFSKDNYNKIQIDSIKLSDRTSLGLARTIIHEGIHARLWEFLYSRDKNLALVKDDFPGIYNYYREHEKNWDHEQMAAYYRETIAQGLKQYDNAQHSDAFYNALAWEGLSEIKDANNNHELIYTEAWNELSQAEQTVLLQTITNEKQNGSKECN